MRKFGADMPIPRWTLVFLTPTLFLGARQFIVKWRRFQMACFTRRDVECGAALALYAFHALKSATCATGGARNAPPGCGNV
jgi:hypothetical protein